MSKGQEFTYLTVKEEMQLSESERLKYYENFRKNILNRKLTNTTPGALTVAPKLKKFVNKLDSFVTKVLAGGEIECVTDGLENIPDGPCIFASTHQGLLDNMCWIPSNPKHCIILHTADAKKFLVLAQLCTGLILVDKNNNNEKSRNASKLDVIQIGRRIRERRNELKISADELGKRIGKDRSTIFRYEKGEIEKLPLEILDPIAAALDTTPEVLLGWDEKYVAETQKNNDIVTDIIIRMQRDPDFFDVAQILYSYDSNKIAFVKRFLDDLNSLHK